MSSWSLLERVTSYVLRPPDEPRVKRPALSLVPDEPEPLAAVGPPDAPLRPVAAVVGLAPRAGTSTLARALAGRLAGLEPGGAAILATADPPRGGIAGRAAAGLAAWLGDTGCEAVRATGRLAIVAADEPLAPLVANRDAPLVADVSHGAPSEAAVALADHVVLVTPPDVEPALALAVEGSLRAAGRGVSLVIARAAEEPPPELGHALIVREARLAAQLTLACREPRGALAPAAAELAERCLAEVIE